MHLVGLCAEGCSLARSRGPSHRRIADELRARISSGEYAVGSRIPSTPQLISLYGVSKTVIRQAVTKLQEEGLLEGVGGVGVEVIATPEHTAAQRITLETLRAQFDDLTAETQALAARVPADLAERLDALGSKIGAVETHLVELYGRLGQPYPRDSATSENRRRTGS